VTRLFVPGRLCLFGEHSDWAGGHRTTHPALRPGSCLVAGTDQGLHGEVARDPGALVVESVLASGERLGPVRIPARLADLDAAARRAGFFRYAAGVAAEMVARFDVGGLQLQVRGDLPVQRGLSSSAAICVLVARAFARAWGLDLDPREEMALAWAGERRTGSVCGRMDQICAFGRRVSWMRFDGDAVDVAPVEPGGTFHFLVVDLRRGKDTRRILADLNACFPDAPGALAAGVRHALGPANEALVARAREALRAGAAAAVGALMDEAQALFDARVAPACPELAAPRLREVRAHAAVRELGLGAKGVGSQGDGSAQILVRGEAERELLAKRLRVELGLPSLPLTLRAEDPAAR
jgi:galactokinase